MVKVERNYKFILAFENSICEDYVTEKVFVVMQYYIVPVVMGGANYSEHLPPNSFIDVRDFNSPQELAAFLKEVAQDDARYRKYFEWKTLYTAGGTQLHCDVCEYINKNWNKTEILERFDQFWSRKRFCTDPLKYFEHHFYNYEFLH